MQINLWCIMGLIYKLYIFVAYKSINDEFDCFNSLYAPV